MSHKMTPQEHAQGWYAQCDCKHPHGVPWRVSVLSALRRARKIKEFCPAIQGPAMRVSDLQEVTGGSEET